MAINWTSLLCLCLKEILQDFLQVFFLFAQFLPGRGLIIFLPCRPATVTGIFKAGVVVVEGSP